MHRNSRLLVILLVVGLGALQSLVFEGVGPDESDMYQLKFEKLEWRT